MIEKLSNKLRKGNVDVDIVVSPKKQNGGQLKIVNDKQVKPEVDMPKPDTSSMVTASTAPGT